MHIKLVNTIFCKRTKRFSCKLAIYGTRAWKWSTLGIMRSKLTVIHFRSLPCRSGMHCLMTWSQHRLRGRFSSDWSLFSFCSSSSSLVSTFTVDLAWRYCVGHFNYRLIYWLIDWLIAVTAPPCYHFLLRRKYLILPILSSERVNLPYMRTGQKRNDIGGATACACAQRNCL